MTGEKYSKTELFETMPIRKALAKMAIPTIISQLINVVYNVVDTFYIGRTGNSYMVAGTTLAFTLFMLTVAFGNLFGIGGGSLIARLAGQKRDEEARSVSVFAIAGTIGIALLYSLLLLLFLNPILRGLGGSEATIPYARQYVTYVIILGSVPVILSAVLAHLLRNTGLSKQASIGLSGGGILNIVLDPLFMFVLLPEGMEVLGASLATLLSNIGACIYLFIVYKKASHGGVLSTHPADLKRVTRENIRGLFSVGVPSAILIGLFDIANVVLIALMAGHGDLQVAAIGIVMKAERLPNAVNLGISQGMLPIVAYNFASGNKKRMNEAIRTARVIGLTISLLSLAVLEVFARPVVRFFLSTASGSSAVMTVALATTFLRYRCCASPVQFLNYSSSYCLQAMGDGKDTLIHAVFREIVFYIPFMYLLNSLFGAAGLACSLVAGEACGAVVAIWLLQRWIRKGGKKGAAV